MNKSLTIFILILSLFVTSLAQKQRKVGETRTERADLPAKHLNEGNNFLRNGSFSSAIKSYNQSIQLLRDYNKDPSKYHSRYENADLRNKFLVIGLNARARANQKSGKNNNAQNDFKAAIDVDKQNASTWLNYGLFLDKRNKRTEAMNAFMNAAKYAETDFEAANSKTARKAKRIASDAKYKLGRLTGSKNPNKAKEYYQESISLNAAKYQAYLFLGKIYENNKQYTNMLNTYKTMEDVLKKLPRKYRRNVEKQLPVTRFQQAVALYELKRYNQAISKLNQTLGTKKIKTTEQFGSYYYLGLAHKKLSQNGKAKSFFRKVTKGIYKSNAEHEIKYGFET